MPIPRLIHFVALGCELPEWAAHNIEAFRRLNPDYRILVHRDDGMLLPTFRPGYDAIKGKHPWSRRSDLVRVSILAKFGGWYWDWDFLPLRPIADIDRCTPAEGQCAFWWLGQQGFVVKLGETVCYLDARSYAERLLGSPARLRGLRRGSL